MRETEQNLLYERDLQRLKNFRLMDDDFFSEALDGKIKAYTILKEKLQKWTMHYLEMGPILYM